MLRTAGRIVVVGALASVAFVVGVVPAAAQATAQISGAVTDASGGVLPGVTVTATQTDTGLTRSVTTDETGSYVLPNLPTGPYRLEAALQGFRTYAQTGIVLRVAATPAINVVLALGNLQETVSVEAAAPLVDVQSAGISHVVDNERILELPLQGRQVTDLIVLAGAAVQAGNPSARTFPGGVTISVAGGLPIGVGYVLDGASHNSPQSNVNLPMPFPDALQEFRVATSGLTAQNGMHAAASVNAITKSGTNTFHGNAFEFLRDRRLNATSPFAAIGPDGTRQDDGLRRNQFGGTIGGPIAANGLRALKRWSRRNSKALPWKLLVPDLVTAFTDAAECMPFCAERPLVATLNSCSASGNGSGRLALFCGLLCIAPSRRYATPNDSPPATEMLTPPCMLRLSAVAVWMAAPASTIRSVTWRAWSGSSRMRSFSTTSLMPALFTSMSGVAPSTVIVSATSPSARDTLIVGVAATCSTIPVWT